MVEEYASPRKSTTEITPKLKISKLSKKQKELLYKAYFNLIKNNGVIQLSLHDGRGKLSGVFNISQGKGFLDESGNLVFQLRAELSGKPTNGYIFIKRVELQIIISPEGRVSVTGRRINWVGAPLSPWSSAELKTDIFEEVDNNSLFIKNFKKALSMFDISWVRISFRRAIEKDPRSALLTTADLGPIHIDRLNNITVDGQPLWKYSRRGAEEVKVPETSIYAAPATVPPSSPEVTSTSIKQASEAKKKSGGMSSREYYEGHAWALALYLTYGDYDRLPEDIRELLDRKTYSDYVKYYSKYGVPQGVLGDKGLEVDKLQAVLFLSLLVLGTGKVGMETIRNVVNSGVSSEAEFISKLASDPQLVASAVGKKGYQAYFQGLSSEEGSFESALRIIKKARDARAKWATRNLFQEKLSILSSPPVVEEPREVEEATEEEETPKTTGSVTREGPEEQEEAEEETTEEQPKTKPPAPATETVEAPATEISLTPVPGVNVLGSARNGLRNARSSQKEFREDERAIPLAVSAEGNALILSRQNVIALISQREDVALLALIGSLGAVVRGIYSSHTKRGEPLRVLLPSGSYDRASLRNIKVRLKTESGRIRSLVSFDDDGNAYLDVGVLGAAISRRPDAVPKVLEALGVSLPEGVDLSKLSAEGLAAFVVLALNRDGKNAYLSINRGARKPPLLLQVLPPQEEGEQARIVPLLQQAGGVRRAPPTRTQQVTATVEGVKPPQTLKREQETSPPEPEAPAPATETVETPEEAAETPQVEVPQPETTTTEAPATEEEFFPPEPEEIAQGAEVQQPVSAATEAPQPTTQAATVATVESLLPENAEGFLSLFSDQERESLASEEGYIGDEIIDRIGQLIAPTLNDELLDNLRRQLLITGENLSPGDVAFRLLNGSYTPLEISTAWGDFFSLATALLLMGRNKEEMRRKYEEFQRRAREMDAFNTERPTSETMEEIESIAEEVFPNLSEQQRSYIIRMFGIEEKPFEEVWQELESSWQTIRSYLINTLKGS